MTTEQKLREAFEARMTDNGKWPRAVEQGRNGCYLLAQTENAWAEWQACAEALATTEPDMPMSMNQFGRLVELAREHLSDNTFVYKATSKTGDTCHFGVETAAKAWAKSGAVEAIKVRDFKLISPTSKQPLQVAPAVNQQLTTGPVDELPEPHAVITGKLGAHCSFNSNELRKGDPIYTEDQMRAAMANGANQ